MYNFLRFIYGIISKFCFYISKKLSRKGLYEFLENSYNKLPDKAKILNIGSGGAIWQHFSPIAQNKSFEVQSFDINADRNPDIIGDICTYQFPKNSYDAVVMAEVMEHVHSPKEAINNIYSSLKDDGVLILTTPFIFPIHDSPYDYFRYTRHGLELLLKDKFETTIKGRTGWGETISVLIARNLVGGTKGLALLTPFIAWAVWPFFRLLEIIIKNDSITCGYTVFAKKISPAE